MVQWDGANGRRMLLGLDGHEDLGLRIEDNELVREQRVIRVKVGPKKEQFAAKVGVTWSTANRWENGTGKPSPLAMWQIKALEERAKQKPQ